MKLNIYVLMIIGLLGFTTFAYAQPENSNISVKEVKNDTKELFKSIGNYTVDKKDQALKRVKNSLDKLDENLDSLESKVDNQWDKMSKTVQKKTRQNLRSLRKQRNQVAQWYGSMKSSTADAWESTKKGFSKAYGKLEETWEKAEKQFDSK
ncbi:hypothetical protein [Arcobacter sp. CECT 8985]|uniref:hypothetical protein n=1 Tax=Arcobacter sp. CECT 8985 TaxID=1935424 RepID=UPI00100AD334|nr:hypothetical protein [Arcobacter sp. CECT 8985]RXJ83326.1 hypothetical protein CRU93_13900 [Arcobacter sp. CECT 8985]